MNETKRVKAKDFDWEAFNHDHIVICIDAERDLDYLHRVLQLLDSKGYRWAGLISLLNKQVRVYKDIAYNWHDRVIYLGTMHDDVVNINKIFWSFDFSTSEYPVKIDFCEKDHCVVKETLKEEE